MATRRVMAFIDGFNLYHSIDDLKINNHLKWLDLWQLCDNITNSTEELIGVKYFTALTHWDSRKKGRHKIYLKAIKDKGVEVVKGRFSKTTKTNLNNGNKVELWEEKETDINIATNMIRHAYQNDYDQAMVITGDTDQVPTIDLIKNIIGKEVKVVLPINRRADQLKDIASFHETLNVEKLENCTFPDRFSLKNGNEIRKPGEWN